MCTYSMIVDHYTQKWEQLQPRITLTPPFVLLNAEPAITDAEIKEFRTLLDRAREYDKKTGQPDCETDEKRQLLKAVADKLGIDVSFV